MKKIKMQNANRSPNMAPKKEKVFFEKAVQGCSVH